MTGFRSSSAISGHLFGETRHAKQDVAQRVQIGQAASTPAVLIAQCEQFRSADPRSWRGVSLYNRSDGPDPRRESLLLLFLVAALGYPLGQLRVAGTNLGVGAVLFAGLAVGSLDPSLRLPDIVYLLGLVLFVYTVGLANGASFVAALYAEGGCASTRSSSWCLSWWPASRS